MRWTLAGQTTASFTSSSLPTRASWCAPAAPAWLPRGLPSKGVAAEVPASRRSTSVGATCGYPGSLTSSHALRYCPGPPRAAEGHVCGRMGVRAHACRTRVCAQRAHACRNERIRAGTARERARLRCTAEGAGGAQERMDMEDCRIPEEYFTCHADSLFDLLAGELARFARHRCAPGPGAAYRQQGARACLLSARRSDTASVRRGRAARRPPGRQRTPCNLHSCRAAVLVMLGPAAPQPVPHGPPRRGRAEPRALCGGG